MKSDKVYDQIHQVLHPGDFVAFRDLLGVVVDLNPSVVTNVFVNCYNPRRTREHADWSGRWVKRQNLIRIPVGSLRSDVVATLTGRYQSRRAEIKRPKWPLPGEYGHEND